MRVNESYLNYFIKYLYVYFVWYGISRSIKRITKIIMYALHKRMLIVFIPQGLLVSCYGFYPMFIEVYSKIQSRNSFNFKCSINSIDIFYVSCQIQVYYGTIKLVYLYRYFRACYMGLQLLIMKYLMKWLVSLIANGADNKVIDDIKAN